MIKQEFLDILRMALSGRVSAKTVEENVSFYEEYINSKVRIGQSEEIVLSKLGDPRLLAKSIISAHGDEQKLDARSDYQYEDLKQKKSHFAQEDKSSRLKVFPFRGWVGVVVGIIAVIIIGWLVFSILSILIPIFLMGSVIVFFVKLFRDWLK